MTYSLDITNFQSIKRQRLEFTGFTVISGKSDLGKSATRRALETVLFNDWQKSYQRTNTPATEIQFSTEELTISCKKSKTDNSFTINGDQINKINKDKPPLPLPFRQDLNISTQLEPMFMVAYKDTENTKLLNQLFGIDILETAQYLASLDLRRTKQEHTKTKEQLDNKNTEIKQLTQQTEQLKAIVEQLEQIDHNKTLIVNYNQTKQDYTHAKQNLEPINNQITQTVALTTKAESTLEVLSMFYAYYDKRVAYNKAKKQLDGLQEVPATTPLENYLQLSSFIKLQDSIIALESKKLQQIDQSFIKDLELLSQFLYVEDSKPREQRLVEIDGVLENINAQLATMVCPACKQPIVTE